MGYQLWTSPTTGYRRRGTRLADFDMAFGKTIKASAIFEPLKSCPADASANNMATILRHRDFDIAGVRETPGAPVVGFVRRERLTMGTVRDHIENIESTRVVPMTITIRPLLDKLRYNPFVFVSADDEITGIITLADLNKPIVRVYLFGLISLLEIHLSFWIHQEYVGGEWELSLQPKRLEKAKKTQAERERHGQALALVECLEFADKHTLVIRKDQLRQEFDLGSKRRAKAFLSAAEQLRNTLAHSQYDLVGGSSWNNLIELVQRVEGTISHSDGLVEARALAMGRNDIGSLW